MASSLQAPSRSVLCHPPSVLDAVHPRKFVAVERRDRDLDDALPRLDHLEDDLGVEVVVVRVQFEADRIERTSRVCAVAAVPFTELHARHEVLPERENLVADELVFRHSPGECTTLREHPRSEDDIGTSVDDRLDHRRQVLGCVLPVAVQQHDDVDAVVDHPPVARLLVAAVSEVHGATDHLQGQVGARALQFETDLERFVGACVVADEDDVDPRKEVAGDPIEHPGESVLGVVRDDEDADAHAFSSSQATSVG